MLSAARNAPITIIRPEAAVTAAGKRRSPSSRGVCLHHATIRHACAASARARPGRSLIGRTARYQNSGHEAAIAVAANAVDVERAQALAQAQRRRRLGKTAEHDVETADRQQTAEQRQHRQRLGFDHRRCGIDAKAGNRRRDLAEENVDRIAGRMRPMGGDVEVADAEREVDRVDVFERWREERDMREREDQRQRGQRARRGHDTGRRRSASFRLPRR